jgi:dTDP-4-dehydrorhamnose 3,5-epimerase
MRFTETAIEGVVVVEIERIEDDRGFFARSWCSREFAEHGLHASFVQENIGFNTRRGTLRGLHFQEAPHEEVKLVRCVRGAVWDVALDLRRDSVTFGRWFGTELNAKTGNMLHVPVGCAHGYLSLVDSAEIRYLTSQFYVPEASSGVPYDDPAFSIEWPSEVLHVSERDLGWPRWVREFSGRDQT